ncbi:HalOD1 output domain-containing protein [Haloferax sp. Q22]|uniref:HalOD1 output domain-containing protein n=1 Tax=Haloferax sp. (strain Q22) TaxID=1526048 RepID=UPI000737D195|nr:HalOD1 output domain-containing protein [Haloferax sp. Q22]
MSGSCDLDRTVEFYPEEGEYRSSFHQEGEKVSIAVIETVATIKDEDPLELETLDQAVDPRSLEALFEDSDATGQREGLVRFHYEGFQVDVDYRVEEIRLQPLSEVTGSS